ncbi:unnamed protein product [Psylliodes chrysocephalus]|uniref:Transposase n=1 Tax=Psylliodes chrysocephalus TaxID=3402493 RepID=A0A9P0D1S1_9CUCU|nr:unnamed protein product [Psylliodes chrysocephala]
MGILVQVNLTSSTHHITRQSNVNHATVLRCLYKEKLHAYKITFTQKLTEDDPDRRMEFCEMLMENLDRNEIDIDTILFSDELTFTLNRDVNRQNCRWLILKKGGKWL